jgi:hypothetical protein
LRFNLGEHPFSCKFAAPPGIIATSTHFLAKPRFNHHVRQSRRLSVRLAEQGLHVGEVNSGIPLQLILGPAEHGHGRDPKGASPTEVLPNAGQVGIGSKCEKLTLSTNGTLLP